MLTQWHQSHPNKQPLKCQRPNTQAAWHCASKRDCMSSGSPNLNALESFGEQGNACMRRHTQIIKIKIAYLHMLRRSLWAREIYLVVNRRRVLLGICIAGDIQEFLLV